MKVLHITNNYPTKEFPIFGIFVKEQIESLSNFGIENTVFFINGREKGKIEYLKSIFRLRKLLKNKQFDVIHCHHILSAIILILSRRINKNKIVVSFQNDPSKELGKLLYKFVNRYSSTRIFKNNSTFLKTDKNSYYLPNGVNLDFFKPINKKLACESLNLNPHNTYLLFVSSNFIRNQKRFDRFLEVLQILKEKYHYKDIVKLELVNETRNLIPLYMNAADVHLLTSDFEGSPNSVKECMACNTSIVSTNVGNVQELLENVNGCHVSSTFDKYELAELVDKSLKEKTNNARDKLISMKLDIESVAIKLKNIYLRT